MSRYRLISLYLSTVCASAALTGSGQQIATTSNNHTLHYDKPARYFEEALMIGNGKLGGLIYSGIETDSISLNDITLWTGEPDTTPMNPDAYKEIPGIRELLNERKFSDAETAQKKIQGHYSENYQPLGRLYIDHLSHREKDAASYRRTLDIADAEAQSSFQINGGSFTTTYLASAPDSVIAILLQTTAPGGFDEAIRISSQLPHSTQCNPDGTMTMKGHAAWHSLPNYVKKDFKYDPARGTRFCTRLRIIAPGSEVKAKNDSVINITGGSEALILLTNETSFNGFDKNPATEGRDCEEISLRKLDNVASKSFQQIRSAHREDYSRFFDRVKIDLGATEESTAMLPTDVQLRQYLDSETFNPDLEELYYQFARYLLISSSRTEGVPANLQGVWNESILPPWSSNYTTNINLQENYWGAETGNLPEMHMPMLSFVKNLPATGSQTAKAYYGVNRGWCLGHNSDIWAMTNPVGLNDGDPSWANWNMGGAWVATHIWEHYAFSRDREFLEEYYPVLKGAALFCIDWLIDDNGELITSPGTSPENRYITPEGKAVGTAKGNTSDLAMIRECLIDTKLAATELDLDTQLREEIDATLKKLRPYHTGENGNLMEWAEDFKEEDPHHRHQSHLFGLYPGHHLSLSATPEEAAAAARTLEIKGDNTTGWSAGWRVNLYARLNDGENAYHMLRKLLSYVSPDKYSGHDARRGGGTYPNLFDAHSPFQIDGNFGGGAGMTEMLMQSSADEITLLPALPANWGKGSVSGIVARGGFTVDMSWADKKVTSLSITANADGNTTVKFNGTSVPVTMKRGETVKIL